METIECLLHEGLYLVVAEIADAALMGVMDIFVSLERACLDVESYFLVGIAERHAVGGETVHFLYGEHRVVHRIVEDMFVHLYLINNVSGHLQTVLQFAEGREENFLDDLQVAEVAAGQVVHDEGHLLGQRLEFVALRTDEFEHVGVLLVGHD